MEELKLCPITQRRCFCDGAPEHYCAWSEDGECLVRHALSAITKLGETTAIPGRLPERTMNIEECIFETPIGEER